MKEIYILRGVLYYLTLVPLMFSRVGAIFLITVNSWILFKLSTLNFLDLPYEIFFLYLYAFHLIYFDHKSKLNIDELTYMRNYYIQIAHDLLNSLIGCKSAIDYYQSKLEDKKNSEDHNSEDTEIMFQLADEVNQSINLVENMKIEYKIISKMEVSEPVNLINPKRIVESIKSSQKNLCLKQNNSIVSMTCLNNMKIYSYEMMVKRILNNFVSNSLKHNKQMQVHVEFMMMYGNAILNHYNSFYSVNKLKINKDKLYVIFEVHDTGVGIPEINLPLIFNENFTDDRKDNWDGLGMGLPICKNLAMKMGGNILYNSTQIQTTFLLIHPIINETRKNTTDYNIILETKNNQNYVYPFLKNANEKNQSVNQSLNKDMNDLSPNEIFIESKNNSIENNNVINDKEIKLNDIDDHDVEQLQMHPLQNHICYNLLICEDSKMIIRAYTTYLNKTSIPYKIFLDGKYCVEYLEKYIADVCPKCRNNFVIMTDMHMPIIGGLELAQFISNSNLFRNVKIILATAALKSQDDVDSTLFDYILEKPIQFEKVHEYYNNVIGQNGI